MQGQEIAEVRIEGSGQHRDLVVIPKTGEHVRLPSTADVTVETEGHVLVRAGSGDGGTLRVSFSGDLLLGRGEIHWKQSETEWNGLWRRARTRSRPWWQNQEALEIELDGQLKARILIVGRARP